MWFPMLGHRCRSQNITFSGKTKWFTEQISPENSYVPKITISLKNVTKCHEISKYLEPAKTLLRRHDAYVRATRVTGLGKTYMAITWHKFL